MKLHLMQQLLDLNQAFENVIFGLERMEKAALFDKDQVRYARAEVEGTRVDVNCEFFDKFGEIVEKDAAWAYKFRRDHDRQTRDPFDLYLEVQQREEERKKRGLPPRAVLLLGWDQDDEPPFKQQQAKKALGNRTRIASKPQTPRATAARKPRTAGRPRPRKEARFMAKRKSSAKSKDQRFCRQYPGVRGKVVAWAEHTFEEGMLDVRVWSRGVTRWFRCNLSVAGPFVRRRLNSRTMLPSSHLAHRTGYADFPLPALGERVTKSPAGDCASVW